MPKPPVSQPPISQPPISQPLVSQPHASQPPASQPPAFETCHPISFGDCDPAGILFYPHHFRLMDATFQAWLRLRGLDQATIQARLGAVGTGLLDAQARFRAPLRDGCVLRHELTVARWERRTLHLGYRGFVGGTLALEGEETRGLFVREAGGEAPGGGPLRLAEIAPLRALLGA